MSLAVVIPDSIRRLPAIILAGMFLLMASGLAHSCDGEHETPGKSQHVALCACACHNHLPVLGTEAVEIEFGLSGTRNCQIDNDSLPDAEPTGIFRPPKYLV